MEKKPSKIEEDWEKRLEAIDPVTLFTVGNRYVIRVGRSDIDMIELKLDKIDKKKLIFLHEKSDTHILIQLEHVQLSPDAKDMRYRNKSWNPLVQVRQSNKPQMVIIYEAKYPKETPSVLNANPVFYPSCLVLTLLETDGTYTQAVVNREEAMKVLVKLDWDKIENRPLVIFGVEDVGGKLSYVTVDQQQALVFREMLRTQLDTMK